MSVRLATEQVAEFAERGLIRFRRLIPAAVVGLAGDAVREVLERHGVWRRGRGRVASPAPRLMVTQRFLVAPLVEKIFAS